jgi:hypothetical protein
MQSRPNYLDRSRVVSSSDRYPRRWGAASTPSRRCESSSGCTPRRTIPSQPRGASAGSQQAARARCTSMHVRESTILGLPSWATAASKLNDLDPYPGILPGACLSDAPSTYHIQSLGSGWMNCRVLRPDDLVHAPCMCSAFIATSPSSLAATMSQRTGRCDIAQSRLVALPMRCHAVSGARRHLCTPAKLTWRIGCGLSVSSWPSIPSPPSSINPARRIADSLSLECVAPA